MEDFVAFLWVAAPILGAAILGVGLVWGITHSRRRRGHSDPPPPPPPR